ncbi:MAG: molybdopterin oxidoreductase family protein, partial [Thermodesulfobacteriota bacterium]
DHDFIASRTENIDELKAKVREYAPEKVSRITGISPETLQEIALLYGRADRAMILYAMGITQHLTGTDNVKALSNLALATGNIGRPSTGVNPLRGQNNVQGACDMGALPDVLTAYKKVSDQAERKRFEDAWQASIPDTPGLTLGEMMNNAVQGTLKGMLVVGENPMISDPDTGHVKKALQALELLVVQDMFLTETAQLADVVLPACSFAEKDGTFTNTERRVQLVRQALEPLGQSKPDWVIVSELAKAMGAGGFEYASPAEIMQEIAALTPTYAGISHQRLEAGESLQWPCPDETHPGTPYLHGTEFPRGKGLFFALDHVPPAEMPDEDYPFLLSTGRIPFHFHGGSMSRKIERLNREAPTGQVDIHPEDAERLGLDEGIRVTVSSRRGAISLPVHVSRELDPGIVFIPMHFSECGVNTLTGTRVDPVSKIPGLKVSAVKIEKTG